MSRSSPYPFPALPPHLVPSMQLVRSQLDACLLAGIGEFAHQASTLTHAASIRALNALRERLPAGDAVMAPPVNPPMMSLAYPELADDATHDRYFHVCRVQKSEGTAFVRSVLAAAGLFHAEMDCRYAPADAQRFAALGGGFAALLGRIAGFRLAPVEYTLPATHAAPTTVDPMLRWMLGHQIFTALTQGIIFALQDFEAAMRVPDAQHARDALCLAADLMTASATAFRFTADFPALAYRDVVRPSMMSSDIGEGFSGLLSIDHRRLVALLVRIRPLMGESARRLAVEHERLNLALNHVYGDHKFVCAQFGGAEKPSLRCPHSSPLPAVEQLERYQRARVDLLRATIDGDTEFVG